VLEQAAHFVSFSCRVLDQDPGKWLYLQDFDRVAVQLLGCPSLLTGHFEEKTARSEGIGRVNIEK
jgi:hypothetical protein